MYSVEDATNFVFEQNMTSQAEADFYRAEAMDYISGIILANRGRYLGMRREVLAVTCRAAVILAEVAGGGPAALNSNRDHLNQYLVRQPKLGGTSRKRLTPLHVMLGNRWL